MWYYVPVDDGGKKYWDVMYTLRPSTSFQMPNIELHRPGIDHVADHTNPGVSFVWLQGEGTSAWRKGRSRIQISPQK